MPSTSWMYTFSRRMSGFRFATPLTIIVALVGGTVGDAKSQTVDTQRPKSPARLAADIAHTISIRASRVPPSAPVAFDSATSHDNSVEVTVHYKRFNPVLTDEE
jgi:hypothetical protein